MCLAIPGRVVSLAPDGDGLPMGKVDFGGVVKDVCFAYLPDVAVGEYALIHVGFALHRIDQQTARDTLALMEDLAEDS
jgi:hydrogenase expression/formation protein HypC